MENMKPVMRTVTRSFTVTVHKEGPERYGYRLVIPRFTKEESDFIYTSAREALKAGQDRFWSIAKSMSAS